MQKFTRFQDIPQFTRDGNYRVNLPWEYLEDWLQRQMKGGEDVLPGEGLNLDPDFQRAHVWAEAQQAAYVEFRLRGGKSGRDILFNHPGWMGSFKGEFVIVDGKQRLEAVRKFMRDELIVFGSKYSEFTDKLRVASVDFIVVVNDLKTRAEVLQWYIEFNAGGTPHTDAEIAKVVKLLAAEKGKQQ